MFGRTGGGAQLRSTNDNSADTCTDCSTDVPPEPRLLILSVSRHINKRLATVWSASPSYQQPTTITSCRPCQPHGETNHKANKVRGTQAWYASRPHLHIIRREAGRRAGATMPQTESCGAAGLRDGSLQKTPALRRLSANHPAESSQLPGTLRHPFGSEERGGLRKQDGATGRNLGAEVALPCESPGRILAPWTLGTAGRWRLLDTPT